MLRVNHSSLLKTTAFCLLVLGIVYFQIIRLPQISDKAIFRGSYGEAQYSDWADSIRRTGLFWGYYNEGVLRQGFPTYVPVASYVNYLICPDRERCEPMVLGRVVALLLSLSGLFFLFRALSDLGVGRNIALSCAFLVSSVPIYSWTCLMFYNEPYSFFVLSGLAAAFAFFSKQNKVPMGFSRAILFCGFIFLGLLKPTNLAPFVFLFPLIFLKTISNRVKVFIKTATMASICVAGFVVSQRLIFPDSFKQGPDLLIFKIVDFKAAFSDVFKNFKIDFGFFAVLGCVSILYFLGSLKSKKENLIYFGFYSIGCLLLALFFLEGLRIHNYYLMPFLIPITALTGLSLQNFKDWVAGYLKKLDVESLLAILIVIVVAIFYRGNIQEGLSSSGNPDVRLAMSFAEDRSANTESCYGFVGDIVAIPQYFLFPRCRIQRGNTFLDLFERELDSGHSITYFYEKRLLELPQNIVDKTKNCEQVEFVNYKVFSCKSK